MDEGEIRVTPKKMPGKHGKKKVVGLRVSSDCSQGGRKYMEDVISIVFDRREDSDYACFAVYDGHGGRPAAVFARDHLWENIKKQRGFFTGDHAKVMAAIKEGFLVTQAAMEKVRHTWPLTSTGYPSTSGTTVAMVIINNNNMYVAHVGDSRIVAGVKNRQGRIEPKALTIDHKPSNRREIERIEKLGGQVLYKNGVPRVVWTRTKHSHKGPVRRSTNVDHIPFLAVARSLGDLWSYQCAHEDYLVSPEPDITHHIIDPEHHRFLVIGSDGVWNMLSVYDAVRQVEKYSWERANKGVSKPMNYTISKQLVHTTINKWNASALRADNTTVITVFFEFPEILDDEEDQVDLASVRQWRDIGLSLNKNYQFDGSEKLLEKISPSRFDPFTRGKCWHYNFTSKTNEICKVCREVIESEQVRAYNREQTVYMQSPKGPWIHAEEHRAKLDRLGLGKKRKAEDDDGIHGKTKKHKMEESGPDGETPNKEIMVQTVKGMVRVQIYGFGKTDKADEEIPKDKTDKEDAKKEDSKDEKMPEVKKIEDDNLRRDLTKTFEAEKDDGDDKNDVDDESKTSAEKSAEGKKADSEKAEATKSLEPAESSKSRTDESQAKVSKELDSKAKASVAIKVKKPVPTPSFIRKSPRTSSKLTCLKDSNFVPKTRAYNTRYSLSPKGAIKRALRTVNSKSVSHPRQRSKSGPAVGVHKNRVVTRSAVKIR